MKIFKLCGEGETDFIFAETSEEALNVLEVEAGIENNGNTQVTELTLEEADQVGVMLEDYPDGCNKTTLGQIFRETPDRGYVCGSNW